MKWTIDAVWKMTRLAPLERCEVIALVDELGQSSPSSDWRSWIKKGNFEVLVETNATAHFFLVLDLKHVLPDVMKGSPERS